MATTSLSTLGAFEFRIGEQLVELPSTQKARALLVYLILHRGKDASRETILELFWPDVDPDRARQSLKTATWSIRRSIKGAGFDPDDFLEVGKVAMRWTAQTEVDAEKFLGLARSKEPAAHLQAIEIYKSDFLETNYEEWVIGERERLATTYERVLAAALKSSGDPALAQRLIARNPYDENAWSALIEAEIAAARPFTARVLVERCREALREVGSSPSTQFEERFQKIAAPTAAPGAEFKLPFVGRESELAAIVQSLADLKRGAGSLTVVEGEAGIGKSTLFEHAQRAATESGLQVLAVRAIVNDPRSFGPWGALFEEMTGQQFGDFAKAGGSDVAQRLAAELCNHLPEHGALFVDDVHEFRSEAFEVFASITSLAPATGRAVVAATRPEGLARVRSTLRHLTAKELRLKRLARDQVDAAVRQTIDAVGETLSDFIFARSGGHPFFLTELFHAFTQEGIVQRDGARWKARELPVKELPLPDNVRNFIDLRLRARGDDAANVACALAIDPEASTADLADALALDEDRVMDAIDDLLALGLIDQPQTGPEFAFTHHLIAEVAATLVNSARRTSIHAVFARRLEGAADRDASLRRARHLAAAHEPSAAARAYVQAATEALEFFAWRDALTRCGAGLTVLEKFKGSDESESLFGRLNLLKARAHQSGGDDEAAVAPIGEAVEHARNARDTSLLMEALKTRALILLNCHHIKESLACAHEASEIAVAHDDQATLAQSNIISCATHMHIADENAAIAAGEAAVAAALKSARADVITAAADQLVRAQMTWWHYADALKSASLGMQAAERAGWVLEGSFHFTQGALWYYLERYDDAEAELRKASTIAEDEEGERRWLISLAGIDRLKLRFFTRYMLGVTAAARRRYEEAAVIAQALSEASIYRSSYMVRNNVLNLWIDALLGRDAQGDAHQASDLVRKLQPDEYEQGSILDLSTCLDLTRARVAARLHSNDAGSLLDQAFATVEHYADARPLECDRAFSQLATCAADLTNEPLKKRAGERFDHYRMRRIEAAGAAWGGQTSPFLSPK